MIVVIISIDSYITWAFDVPARLRRLAAAKTVLSAASRALMSKTSASTGVALARTVAAATRVARIGRVNSDSGPKQHAVRLCFSDAYVCMVKGQV
jgi:hypothetical protein